MRAVRKWNELPDVVRNQSNVNSFKNAYDRWKKKGEKWPEDEQIQQQQQQQQ